MDTIPFNVMEGYGAFEGKEAVVLGEFRHRMSWVRNDLTEGAEFLYVFCVHSCTRRFPQTLWINLCTSHKAMGFSQQTTRQ
jgi:hypothetical protein